MADLTMLNSFFPQNTMRRRAAIACGFRSSRLIRSRFEADNVTNTAPSDGSEAKVRVTGDSGCEQRLLRRDADEDATTGRAKRQRRKRRSEELTACFRAWRRRRVIMNV